MSRVSRKDYGPGPGPGAYVTGELVLVRGRVAPDVEPTEQLARVVRRSRTYLTVRNVGQVGDIALTRWDVRLFVRKAPAP